MQRARVAGLLREGRLDRALRVIARADRLCPTSAPSSDADRVTALTEVGREDEARAQIARIEHEAGASDAAKGAAAVAKAALLTAASGTKLEGEALYAQGLAQLAAGNRPSAQRLFDRAIVAIERAVRPEPGQERAQLALDTPNGISGRIEDVTWVRAGDRPMLAVAHDEQVSLFDGSTYRLRKSLPADSTVDTLSVSPDGRTLAVGSFRALQLWDVATGKEIWRLAGAYTTAVWSGDGKTMAVINADPVRVEIWDTATRAVRRVIVPSPAPPPKSAKSAKSTKDRSSPALAPKRLFAYALRLSEKGDRVAASFSDATARVWSSASGEELHLFDGHKTNVYAVLFSRDDQLFITADQDGAQVYEGKRFTPRRTFDRGFSGQVAFTQDQRSLAISTVDGLVLWDLGTGKETSRFENLMPDAIAVEPGGKRVVVSEIGRVVVLDLERKVEIQRIDRHAPAVSQVVWMPDGAAFVSGSWDGTVRFWNAKTGAPFQSIDDLGFVNSVALSADGRFLASGSAASKTALYRLPSGEKVESWEGARGFINALAFSPDGKQLLIGAADGEVQAIDLSTRRVARATRTQGSVNALAFSPDGTMVAEGTGGAAVYLLEAASLNTLEVVTTTSQVHALSFDPAGRTLLVGSQDVQRFDTLGGHLRQGHPLSGHRGWVTGVAASPDGKVVATGSADGLVRLWDEATGALLHPMSGHVSAVTSVVFRPDGKLLASSSEDGTIRLWSVEQGREVLAFRAVEDTRDAYAVTPAPNARIELFGEAGRAFPLCRIGESTYRFELCQERFEVPGLSEKVLAGDESYLDP